MLAGGPNPPRPISLYRAQFWKVHFSGTVQLRPAWPTASQRRFRRDNRANIEESAPLNRSVVDVDYTTEPSQMSGPGRSMNFWHAETLRFARLKSAARHPSALCQAASEPLGWTAVQRVSPTSHGVESAIRVRAVGYRARTAKLTRDANRCSAHSNNSAKRSKTRRWP